MKRKPYVSPKIEVIQIEPEGIVLGSPGDPSSLIPIDDDENGSIDRKPRSRRDWEDYEAF